VPFKTLAELHQKEDAEAFSERVGMELGLSAPIQKLDLPTYISELASRSKYGIESASGAPLAVQFGGANQYNPANFVRILNEVFGHGGAFELVPTITREDSPFASILGTFNPRNLLIQLAEASDRGSGLELETIQNTIATGAHELRHRANEARGLKKGVPIYQVLELMSYIQSLPIDPEIKGSLVRQVRKSGMKAHHKDFIDFELQNTPREVLRGLAESGVEIPESFIKFDPELEKAVKAGEFLK